MDPHEEAVFRHALPVRAEDPELVGGAGKKACDPGLVCGHILHKSIAVVNEIVGDIVNPAPLEIDPVPLVQGNDMGEGRRLKLASEAVAGNFCRRLGVGGGDSRSGGLFGGGEESSQKAVGIVPGIGAATGKGGKRQKCREEGANPQIPQFHPIHKQKSVFRKVSGSHPARFGAIIL